MPRQHSGRASGKFQKGRGSNPFLGIGESHEVRRRPSAGQTVPTVVKLADSCIYRPVESNMDAAQAGDTGLSTGVSIFI